MEFKSISVKEMQKLEENAFASGISVIELMEKAGRGCAQLILSKVIHQKIHQKPRTKIEKNNLGKLRIFIFCGPGNNGGDGLVCARYLSLFSQSEQDPVEIIVILPIEPKTDAARVNLKRIEKMQNISVIGPENLEDARRLLEELEDIENKTEKKTEKNIEIVVDALLGIGARGVLRSPIKETCDMININSANTFKISIDIPTGMDADTGETDEHAVRPDATICIQAVKQGVEKARKVEKAIKRAGELWVLDIGLDHEQSK